MTKEKPKLMYSEKDVELIKSVFCENDELLIALRHLFFGQEITSEQKIMIKQAFSNPEIIEVVKRKIGGFKNYNTPIGNISDEWMGIESQIFGASRDTIYQAVYAKSLVIDMLKKAFDLMANPDGEKISIEYNPDTVVDPLQVKLIARNLYIKAIETALSTMKIIAGMKDETTEQAMKRITQDSNK